MKLSVEQLPAVLAAVRTCTATACASFARAVRRSMPVAPPGLAAWTRTLAQAGATSCRNARAAAALAAGLTKHLGRHVLAPWRNRTPSAMRQLFQRFRGYVEEQRNALGLAALAMIGVAAAEVLRPWPLKIVFDGLLVPTSNKDAATQFFVDTFGRGELLLAVAAVAILAVAIVGGLCAYAQTVLLATVGRRVVTSIRYDLYRHIQCLSQSFHDTASAGDLLTRLTGDVRLVRDLLVTSVIFIVGRTLVLVGTIAVMLMVDWQLTLIALVFLPLLIVSTFLFSRRIKLAARQQRKTEGRITHVMAENLEQIRVIQAHAREDFESGRFQRENASSAEGEVKTARLEASMDRAVDILLAVGTCAVLWFGVLRVQSGAISAGDLLVFTAYLAAMHKPVRKIASLTGKLAKAAACGERVLAILDREPEIVDRPGADDGRNILGRITFEEVSFAYYGGERRVLENMNLDVRCGETIALVSPSGTGKSTIAHLLLRFYEPSKGRITIDGRDIRDYSLAGLRENVSVLLQEAVLFSASLHDNIAYGCPDATREQVIAAATAARAHAFIDALPDGYDTIVGRRGATLSGGQRQRIAIARAMIRKSPIVVLDEPGTGLDEANEAQVMEAIRELVRGRTCIIITHSPAAAAFADRIIDIRDGVVVERDMPGKDKPSVEAQSAA